MSGENSELLPCFLAFLLVSCPILDHILGVSREELG